MFPNGITEKEATDIMRRKYKGGEEKGRLIYMIFRYLFERYEKERLIEYFRERIDGLEKEGYFSAPYFAPPLALKLLGDIDPLENDLPGLIEFGEKELGIGKENIKNIANYGAMFGACVGYMQSILDGYAEYLGGDPNGIML